MSELTKPSEILRLNLEPAFSDYSQEPRDQRLANVFARAADDFVEWTFDYYKTHNPLRLKGAADLEAFRLQLIPQCPPVQMMNDLADAAHHRRLDRPHNPPRVVKTSTAAYYEEAGVLRVKGYDAPFAPAAQQFVEFFRRWPD